VKKTGLNPVFFTFRTINAQSLYTTPHLSRTGVNIIMPPKKATLLQKSSKKKKGKKKKVSGTGVSANAGSTTAVSPSAKAAAPVAPVVARVQLPPLL